jgi:hypothetical protein
MTLSHEATKYRDEFVKAAHAAADEVASKEYRGDLELIKAVNSAIDDLRRVRSKHVRD